MCYIGIVPGNSFLQGHIQNSQPVGSLIYINLVTSFSLNLYVFMSKYSFRNVKFITKHEFCFSS